MSRLTTQLQRLFALPTQPLASGQLPLVGPRDSVRTLVAGFSRGADWNVVAALLHGVQIDWELPAPAISTAADAGYQVWFSLAEPVSLEQAGYFLDALRDRYLASLPPGSYALLPRRDAANTIPLVPALHEQSGKWSAFIDPSLGEMFKDEAGLDMPPGDDRQADMLSGFGCITASDFARVISPMQEITEPRPLVHTSGVALSPAAGRSYEDPRAFLLAVMNDSTVAMADRIDAAKALLPAYQTGGHASPSTGGKAQ